MRVITTVLFTIALAGMPQSAHAQATVADLHALISHSRTADRTTNDESAEILGLLGNPADPSLQYGLERREEREPLGIELLRFSAPCDANLPRFKARELESLEILRLPLLRAPRGAPVFKALERPDSGFLRPGR